MKVISQYESNIAISQYEISQYEMKYCNMQYNIHKI